MNRYKEIDIIRCIVVLMVVIVHTTAPHTGAWTLPAELDSNIPLYYIGKLCYSGMLETFIFISGFLLGRKPLPSDMSAKKSLIYNRFIRLYVPCLFFGVIAVVIINGYDQIINKSAAIIQGIYHLWFLPVLLWCFILELLFVQKIKRFSLPTLAILAVLPYPGMPFNINVSLYYLFFFHLGYTVCKNRDYVYNFLNKKTTIVALLTFTVILLITSFKFINLQIKIDHVPAIISKALTIMSLRIIKFATSLSIIAIYLYIGIKLRESIVYKFASFIAKYSLGIYIFQEIIIRVLYYKLHIFTKFPNYYALIIFTITILISLLFTIILSKNKYTKKLIV